VLLCVQSHSGMLNSAVGAAVGAVGAAAQPAVAHWWVQWVLQHSQQWHIACACQLGWLGGLGPRTVTALGPENMWHSKCSTRKPGRLPAIQLARTPLSPHPYPAQRGQTSRTHAPMHPMLAHSTYPAGVLYMNECGSVGGVARVLVPHPDFRLILALDPRHGEVCLLCPCYGPWHLSGVCLVLGASPASFAGDVARSTARPTASDSSLLFLLCHLV